MKKITSILLALVMLLGLAACGFLAIDMAGKNIQRPQIHGMLTRVEYGDNVVYLFGTMHAGRPDWFPLHPIAEQALARADVIALEIEFDALTNVSPELVAEIVQLQMLPDGLTLADVVPPHIFEPFLVNFASYEALGLTYQQIAHLTPVGVVMLLQGLAMEFSGDAVDFTLSVDSYIGNFGIENNLPLIGLETASEQMHHLLDVPLDIQAYVLVDFPPFGEFHSTFAEDLELLAQAYERQDIDAMLALLEADLSAGSDNPYARHQHHVHFTVRSTHYANQIARLLRTTEEPTTFFVAVGIAHLIGGEFGQVHAILREDGFTLTPLWE